MHVQAVDLTGLQQAALAVVLQLQECSETAQVRRVVTDRVAARLDRVTSEFEATVHGVVRSLSSGVATLDSSARHLSQAADQASHQVAAVTSAIEQASSNVVTAATATGMWGYV